MLGNDRSRERARETGGTVGELPLHGAARPLLPKLHQPLYTNPHELSALASALAAHNEVHSVGRPAAAHKACALACAHSSTSQHTHRHAPHARQGSHSLRPPCDHSPLPQPAPPAALPPPQPAHRCVRSVGNVPGLLKGAGAREIHHRRVLLAVRLPPVTALCPCQPASEGVGLAPILPSLPPPPLPCVQPAPASVQPLVSPAPWLLAPAPPPP